MSRLPAMLTAWAVAVALQWAAAPVSSAQEQEQTGEQLFQEACSSCHGQRGEGTEFGPPIADAGAAAADFQLRTGRMPLADPEAQAVRKPPAFDARQIDRITAYVDSLGGGPPIPEVSPERGDVSLGQELFVANCAPCHGATANGGAVGEGALAPSLLASDALVVAEATLTGPGQMPVFNFSEEELDAVLAYVRRLQRAEDPGGADIGGIGPVPEGFVAWTVGAVAMIVVSVYIGHRSSGGDA